MLTTMAPNFVILLSGLSEVQVVNSYPTLFPEEDYEINCNGNNDVGGKCANCANNDEKICIKENVENGFWASGKPKPKNEGQCHSGKCVGSAEFKKLKRKYWADKYKADALAIPAKIIDVDCQEGDFDEECSGCKNQEAKICTVRRSYGNPEQGICLANSKCVSSAKGKATWLKEQERLGRKCECIGQCKGKSKCKGESICKKARFSSRGWNCQVGENSGCFDSRAHKRNWSTKPCTAEKIERDHAIQYR